ncbi:MAG TPA: arsenate reductase ArsC, partial [Pirellulaceae bacterium]|nr:arsenate reductase ArsC [Pirellulaceae bacterium]
MTQRKVVILCTRNSCRSQMAEAIWNAVAGDSWSAISAGTRPAGYVHPLALDVMSELGIPTQNLSSKSIESISSSDFDLA